MSASAKLIEFLDSSHVRYEVQQHPPAMTAQEVAESEHVSGKKFAKVVILRAGRDFVMAVLPAPYHVDLEQARAALGRRELELAEEDEFERLFPGCEPGAMPPFGNLYGLPVCVDRELTRAGEIVFNAGTHSETVRMRYDDFARLVNPRVAVLAREEG